MHQKPLPHSCSPRHNIDLYYQLELPPCLVARYLYLRHHFHYHYYLSDFLIILLVDVPYYFYHFPLVQLLEKVSVQTQADTTMGSSSSCVQVSKTKASATSICYVVGHVQQSDQLRNY